MILEMEFGINVDMHGFKYDRDTVSRFSEFEQQRSSYRDEASAQRGLRSAFGGSYMYYYRFQRVPVGLSHVLPHYYVGNTFCSQGKVDLAVAHYRHALRLAPGCVEAHIKLGDALMFLDKPGEAAAHYRAALQIKPDSGEARERVDRIKGRKTNDGG